MRAASDFILVGTTAHAHEQAGIDFVREQLPKELHARALIDMFEAHTGRHYEIDFVVIGHGAVFVVEMKDYEGRIEGDEHHWLLSRPGDSHPVVRDNPLSFTNHKCKVLRSKLENYFQRRVRGQRVPYVQPLIFLSNPNVDNRLTGAAKTAVVDRAGLIAALQHGKYPNANPSRWQPINSLQRKGLEAAFDNIGLRPRDTQLIVNGFRLGPVIADGEGYQDREATNEHTESMRARARVYLVPQHTSVDERDRLRRAARREVQLLNSVHGHQNILSVRGFADDAPIGPTLLFDDFEGGVPLDVFLSRETPGFDERVSIFRQLGNALGYCHRREVIHGGLHPGAILVRRHESEIELRIFNFQLGEGRGAAATIHRSILSSDRDKIYQAPELATDPRATSRLSDCYSLGAIGYLLFTDQPPASSFANAMLRLQRDGCLDPAQTDDSLPGPVVEIIRTATGMRDRFDNAIDMVEILIGDLRNHNKEIEHQSTAHVLAAETNDLLLERYTVVRVLGYGASARVLEIKDEQDLRSYALKAARDPEQNERLELEAEVLRSFEHPRIVKLHDSFPIDGLRCLKLSLAGEHTLLKQITEEGGLSFELALRYGEDLLDALEQIEEAGLLHRDIKPANLGVGASKGKKKHLTLFDFSLAAAPDDKLDIGTAAYRDPYLWAEGRGRWDAAADRWSAAITLHEMLTAVRPHFVPDGRSPLDEGVQLVLAAERFDAARRDSLIDFFQRALARDGAARFDSARDMKRAWSACFADARPIVAPVVTPQPADPLVVEPTPSESTQEESTQEPEAPSDEQIAKIQRSTPIRALPLSVRALNALDRAGLTHTEELLSLPNNRLSAIRGIGTKVAREILELRDRWRAILDDRDALEAVHTEPFHDNYRGPERYLDSFDTLPPKLVAALGDAGLHTTGVLARAPRVQVEAVITRVEPEPTRLIAQLRELLSKLEVDDVTAPPATLEAWIAALDIDSKKVADQRLRQLFGLEAPFTGRLDLTVRDLTEHANVTRQAATRNLAEAIKRWAAQPWAPALRSLALQIVDNLAGVAPLPLAAQALRTLLPHDPEAPEALSLARCAALLRAAVELGNDERERGLVMHRRLRGPEQGQPRVVLWLVSRSELWPNIDNLGRKADELAKRPVLAASGETERTLELVVQNSVLSASEIGLSRLVELAAWASRFAAASTRLELYPLGMDPARALELSAQALTNNLDPAEIARRVHARYPEAAPLPDRPALDRLLEPLQLRWDEQLGQYLRPQPEDRPTRDTSTLSLHRPTALGALPKARRSDEQLLADEFADEVRTLVQDRKLRIMAVNAAYLPEALVGLERLMDVRAVALDKLLINAMDEFVRSRGGPLAVLRLTDAAGPEDGNWAQLQAVAKQAAAQLARQLLPPAKPLLLIQPGLLARYDLRDFIRNIVDAAADDRSEAIVLLNPIHEGDRPDRIASRLPIPGLLPGQIMHVPRRWIANVLGEARAS